MTSNVLNKMLLAGAAIAALSVAACSKPADTTATTDNSANAMAASATNDATNTSASTPMNAADNTAAANTAG